MKATCLALLSLCLSFGSVAATPPTQGMLEELVAERMNTLSQRYGITWQRAPAIHIGFPGGMANFFDLARPANFTADPPTIWFNPLPYVPLVTLNEREGAAYRLMAKVNVGPKRTIDHELAHVFMFDEYRRLTGRGKPSFSGPDSLRNLLEFSILDEGFANAVERNQPPPATPLTWWPAAINIRDLGGPSQTTIWEQLVYEGGPLLIGPLIARYPLPVVAEFIITHPLVINERDLRGSIQRWQQQAEKSLQAQQSTVTR